MTQIVLKRHLLPLTILFLGTGATRSSAQSLSEGVAEVAARVSESLAAKGYKNIAVIDFTDLQGRPTELDRFLAERLTLEMVQVGRISVIDRANIRRILAEHKLTEEGLVNPANAKKLGEFAGADAIVMGNVLALDAHVELMVKAIATESSRLEAAGRTSFQSTSDLRQLLNRGVSENIGARSPGRSSPTVGYEDAAGIASKDVGSLRIVLKAAMPVRVPDERTSSMGQAIRLTFDLINLEAQRNLMVSLNATAAPGCATRGLPAHECAIRLWKPD